LKKRKKHPKKEETLGEQHTGAPLPAYAYADVCVC
jgi:hypothetical protein